MINEDLVNTVRQIFGLNLYEARIWLALLAKGEATAGELSDMANVPRSRAYDILESLEKKGFVVMRLGKPIKYAAIPPREVFNRVKQRLLQEAQEKAKKLDLIAQSDLAAQLELLYKQGLKNLDITDNAASIRGRYSVYSQMEAMLRGAEEKVIIFTTETGAIRKVRAFEELFKQLYNRGVNIKMATKITERNVEYLKKIAPYVEIRDSDKINSRMIIVDGKEVLFMLNDDQNAYDQNDVGIWINSEFLAKALDSLVEYAFDKLPHFEKVLEKLKQK
ncbi:NEQ098 [Nanoarchaeum equitans Kin4-M]|uniref:NEQ098 n=1 Tax=Nanoarchaeum equitans (strain Kin4-M) TaxID=228908 RepID=Q74MK1_NANEQ|nr:NEQ098 [Nanoarchaeum equitans Kin4-M]